MFRSLTALALTGVLLVAGCTTPAADQAPPPTSSPSPTADTVDGVTVVKESFQRSFDTKTLTMTARISAGPQQSLDMTGLIDLTTGAVKISMAGLQEAEIMKLADEIFFRSGKAGEEPYLRFQVDKLKATSSLRTSLDVMAHSGILGGVVSAEKRDGAAGSVTYEGVSDVNKAIEAAPAGARAQLEPMSRLATNASAVRYKAIVDSKGRLTDLSYTVETSFGPMASEIQLTGLGEPVKINRPAAADVKEATAADYAIY